MPSATARDFRRVAAVLGFVRRRQTGSHERWIHPDGRSVTIPLHGGREIGPPLFFKIVRDLGLHRPSSTECGDLVEDSDRAARVGRRSRQGAGARLGLAVRCRAGLERAHQPRQQGVGRLTPSGVQHHVVREVRQDLQFRAVGICRARDVARRNDVVAFRSQHQQRRAANAGRVGPQIARLQTRAKRFTPEQGRVAAHRFVAQVRREEESPGAFGRREQLGGIPVQKPPQHRPGIVQKQPPPLAGHPAGGRRRKESRGRRIVPHEVLQHHQAAQGVSDHHRFARQGRGNPLDVVHVVRNGRPSQPIAPAAPAVAAQAQSVRIEAAAGEEVQKVLGPAPRTMTRAVDEQQRRISGGAAAVS